MKMKDLGILVASLTISGCRCNPQEYSQRERDGALQLLGYQEKFPDRPPEPIRTIVWSDSLRTNPDNIVRYVTKKSEREGINDLEVLTTTATSEEFWAYLPNKSEWHEVSYAERSNIFGDRAQVDFNYILGLANENTEIILFHIHTTYLNPEAKQFTEDLEREMAPRYEISVEEMHQMTTEALKIGLATPSYLDINFAGNIHWLYPRNRIRNRIVSPNGVTEFDVTPLALALNAIEWETLIGLYEQAERSPPIECATFNPKNTKACVATKDNDFVRVNFNYYSELSGY